MNEKGIQLRDGSTIVLRRPRERELPAMADVFRVTVREGVYFGVDRFVYNAAEERRLLRSQRGAGGTVVAAFTPRGRLVGFVAVTRGKRRKNRHTACLDPICVLPAFRGRGVGRLLMIEAIAWARRARVEKMWLGVFASNTRAIRLYRSMGFRLDGVNRRQAKIRGRYVDGVNMALWLERYG